MKTTVLIADDHQLIREAWAMTINANPQFSVMAECASADEAIHLSQHLCPDIILMDINLPEMNGIDATMQIRKVAPKAKIIGVSSYANLHYVRKMMQHGARGYVTKSSPSRELFLAMTEVAQGKKYICESIKTEIAEQALGGNAQTDGLHSLSKREKQILDLVKQGYSSKQMADQLSITLKTVEVHRYNILRKLKLKNTAALVNYTFSLS